VVSFFDFELKLWLSEERKVIVMAVQLTISYETLVELIEQLSEAEQKALIERLLSDRQAATLTRAERLAAYHASIMSIPLREEPSIRRENWYDDDGR
jgi:dihydroneopterin aldolase